MMMVNFKMIIVLVVILFAISFIYSIRNPDEMNNLLTGEIATDYDEDSSGDSLRNVNKVNFIFVMCLVLLAIFIFIKYIWYGEKEFGKIK